MKYDAHIVFDQHDGVVAVAVQPTDELGDLVGFLVAHAGGRLVEQQQMRLQGQRHRDLGGALIAMRQFTDQSVRLGFERNQLERIFDVAVDLRLFRTVDPWPQTISAGDFGGDAHVFKHGEFRKDFGNLEGPGHAEGDPLMRGKPGDVTAIEPDGSRGRRKKS